MPVLVSPVMDLRVFGADSTAPPVHKDGPRPLNVEYLLYES